MKLTNEIPSNPIDVLKDNNTEKKTPLSNDVIEKTESTISSGNPTMSDEKVESHNHNGSNVLFFSQEETKAIQENEDRVLSVVENSILNINKYKSDYQSAHQKYNLELVLEIIKLGVNLVKFKQELGSRFFTVINQEVLNSKLIYRYIRLVITLDSQIEYDKTVKGKKENIDLIVLDERIVSLNKSNLSKMINPSINKIENMKPLSNENFKDVINGDDKSYESHMLVVKEKIKNEKMEKEKPSDMDENTFNQHIKDGIFETIRKLNDKSEKVTELSKEVSELKLEIEKLTKENIKLESMNDLSHNMLDKLLPTNGKLYNTQSETQSA